MGEILLGLTAIAFCSWFAFSLGVRRERGRQMRYEEAIHIKKVPRRGVRLKTIKVRR